MHPGTDPTGQAAPKTGGWTAVRRILGGVLAVSGLGWYVFYLWIAISTRVANEVRASLSQLASEEVGVLALIAIGLLPAAAGYALLRARRSSWPTVGQLVWVALGFAWLLSMGTTGVVGGHAAGGLAVAGVGLIPMAAAGYAWTRARRPAGVKAAWPSSPAPGRTTPRYAPGVCA